ncbi:MAG TPA: hypothetical protein VMS86_09100, partial [Thermoanaerobaculia bacterium]|nr:hypothetical protein [Thermoanaerobaculia bacterium]
MSVSSRSARVRVSVILASMVCAGLFGSRSVVEAQPGPDPDRYIVKFRDDRLGKSALRRAGAEVVLD